MVLARISKLPPAGTGTIILIGLVGQAVFALAISGLAEITAIDRRDLRRLRREVCIQSLAAIDFEGNSF
jgi:hypothetical protein